MKILINRNFILTLFLVYVSTYASVVAFSYYTLIFYLLISLFFFVKDNLRFDSLFIKFSIAFFLINIYLFLTLPVFDFLLTGYMYLKFLYAYLSIKVIGFPLFNNIVKIAYFGALISLPFYIFQLLDYDLAFKIVGFIKNSFAFLDFRNDSLANNVIFTINADAPLRNSGFMWEPKGFANFIVIALFFRLYHNGLKILDKKILVFIIALITTFSTTGILCLFVIFLFYFLNKNIKIVLSVFPLFIMLATYIFFSSDFLYKKILYEISLKDEYKTLLQKKDYDSDAISLGRTGSLIVDFNDFLNRPYFGYGYTRENRTQSSFVKLVRVNGFSDILAVYGILGLIFYFYRQYVFLKLLQKKKNYSYSSLITLILIIIYTASTLTAHPFWMSLIFVSCIIPKKQPVEK